MFHEEEAIGELCESVHMALFLVSTSVSFNPYLQSSTHKYIVSRRCMAPLTGHGHLHGQCHLARAVWCDYHCSVERLGGFVNHATDPRQNMHNTLLRRCVSTQTETCNKLDMLTTKIHMFALTFTFLPTNHRSPHSHSNPKPAKTHYLTPSRFYSIYTCTRPLTDSQLPYCRQYSRKKRATRGLD